MSNRRRDELTDALAETRERVAAACVAAQRNVSELNLIVVTKNYPASDLALLCELGVTDVGENRHPEAARKLAELDDLGVSRPVAHFIGAVQTNKAGQIARYADYVHSIDRRRLVESLSRGAVSAGRTIKALVQVDFGDADGRAGIEPENALELAEHVAAADRLTLAGLMTVAPLNVDPAEAFGRLAELSRRLCRDHPEATMISAGMSGDLEQAVQAGATHLRVGRAILKER
jgi:PLP dependent protein